MARVGSPKWIAERFTKDVEHHEMTVLRSDDVYRHLAFRNPDTFQYWFDIITWPGVLTIQGDMGTYVFARIHDMFQFFGDASINPQYWEEKLLATARHEGARRFSVHALREYVDEHFQWWAEDLGPENVTGLRAALDSDILAGDFDYDISAAHRALYDFEYNGIRFSDSWEADLTEYTVQYLWCCHAIVWAIGQHRQARTEVNA